MRSCKSSQPNKYFFGRSQIRLHHTSSGLTLVEVLIASVIGSFVVITGLAVSESTLKANLRILTAQGLRDNWSKLTLLLNADISESCSAEGTSNSLTLRVLASPESSSNQCISSNPSSRIITYVFSGSTLTRSGPPSRRDGSLSLSGVFLPNTSEDISSSVGIFNAINTTKNRPIYRLTLSDNGLEYSGDTTSTPSSMARVRSFD